jgi:hypothetical protein
MAVVLRADLNVGALRHAGGKVKASAFVGDDGFRSADKTDPCAFDGPLRGIDDRSADMGGRRYRWRTFMRPRGEVADEGCAADERDYCQCADTGPRPNPFTAFVL